MTVDVEGVPLGEGQIRITIQTDLDAHSLFSDLGEAVVREQVRRLFAGVNWYGLRANVGRYGTALSPTDP